MRKIIVSIALCMAVVAANAQKAVVGNKFTDNLMQVELLLLLTVLFSKI